MTSVQDVFLLGMKRTVPALLPMPSPGLIVNVGAGYARIPGAEALDLPTYDADRDAFPYETGTVAGIHAYHFLEHLKNPVRFLQEAQRVLQPGGILQICVPYYNSQAMAQDLDHQHAFCEDTWKNLMANQYYNKNRVTWHFAIGFNMILGLVERNLCLITQLIRQ